MRPMSERAIEVRGLHKYFGDNEVLKGIDERLDELGTDYIDLLYYHGLGKKQVDWPKSKEMKDEVVVEKARAAEKWVQFATELAKETGAKPWSYALVADSDITESASFNGLMARSRRI